MSYIVLSYYTTSDDCLEAIGGLYCNPEEDPMKMVAEKTLSILHEIVYKKFTSKLARIKRPIYYSILKWVIGFVF